jgi:hypothetical protein
MELGPAANQIVTFLPPGSLLPSLVGQGARDDGGQGRGVDGHPACTWRLLQAGAG